MPRALQAVIHAEALTDQPSIGAVEHQPIRRPDLEQHHLLAERGFRQHAVEHCLVRRGDSGVRVESLEVIAQDAVHVQRGYRRAVVEHPTFNCRADPRPYYQHAQHEDDKTGHKETAGER